MSTRVYQYGLLAPTTNADGVYKQLRAAHAYRNTLVEIERGRRAALRDALSSYADVRVMEAEVTGHVAVVQELAAAIKAARKASRKRSETKEARESLRDARADLAVLRVKLRERRYALKKDPVLAARNKAINNLGKALRTNARAHSGTFWGTYLLIEQADDASRKQPLYKGVDPNNPKFMRWNGCGQVGIQLQKGLAVDDVFGGDRRLQIDRPDEAAMVSPVRAERRRAARTKLRLRIGSDARDPVWAEWRMIMHRPLPAGARIKWAVVNRHAQAGQVRWSVQLTVEMPHDWRKEKCGEGAVGLDVGWRRLDGELRVAVAVGHDDETHELRLSDAMLSSLAYSAVLRSIRDKNFNLARAALVGALKAAAELGVTPPAWFQEFASHLHLWRSPARLARLCRRWRGERWEGDGQFYEALEKWRYHDQHLRDWEHHQQRKSLLRRREMYRGFAVKLARAYDTIVLEEFNLSRMAMLPLVENDESDESVPRRQRVVASVSELRGALENAFLSRGGTVAYVSAVNTTRTCAPCGHVEAFDAAALVWHQCPKCKAVWDQDENAARVICDSWLKRPGEARKVLGAGAAKAVTEGVKRNRFQRAADRAKARAAESDAK